MQSWFNKGNVAHKIQVGIADGQDGLRQLASEKQSFDLIFIDADKPGYAGYYDLLFELGLVQPNGTIVADNTAFRGVPWVPSEEFGQENGTAMAEFNQKIRYVDSAFQIVAIRAKSSSFLLAATTTESMPCCSPLEMACPSSNSNKR